EPASVERSAGADAVGNRRSGPYHQRAAHAVALRPDLLRFVDLRLRVEERDERWRILLHGARRADRGHQRSDLRQEILVLEVEIRGVRKLRRLADAIKRIGYEHAIAVGGE